MKRSKQCRLGASSQNIAIFPLVSYLKGQVSDNTCRKAELFRLSRNSLQGPHSPYFLQSLHYTSQFIFPSCQNFYDSLASVGVGVPSEIILNSGDKTQTLHNILIQSILQIPKPFHSKTHRRDNPTDLLYILQTHSKNQMSYDFSNHYFKPSDSPPPFQPDHDLPQSQRSNSNCISCHRPPTPVERFRHPNNVEQHQRLSPCVNPMCQDVICDDCSIRTGSCNGCDGDCGLDCRFPLDCDDTYAFGGSDTELFGDQTAQTFGVGSHLPLLITDNTLMNTFDDTISSISSINHDSPASTSNYHFFTQTSGASHRQPQLSQPTSDAGSYHMSAPICNPPLPTHTTFPLTTSAVDYSDSTPDPYDHHINLLSQYPLASKPSGASHGQHHPSQPTSHILGSSDTPASISNDIPSASTRTSPSSVPDHSDSTTAPHDDHINLPLHERDSTTSFPSLQCLWAVIPGQPCGMILRPGEEMHEHLKSYHAVKTGFFCQWLDCSTSVWSSSIPHRFTNSVERHTWGHSRYRPYKCDQCNEGFSAANVRNEHYTNIHQRKKIFACTLCPHQCTSATNLKRHKDDKHSIERFQCEFCNRHGKRSLFPRGPNLARHFRNCKFVQLEYPNTTLVGRSKPGWLPPGYKKGHHGLDRAKVRPPMYLSA